MSGIRHPTVTVHLISLQYHAERPECVPALDETVREKTEGFFWSGKQCKTEELQVLWAEMSGVDETQI